MAYRLIFTNSFKKDLKRCEKRGLPMVKIFEAIKILTENGELPAEYKPHKLSGKRQGQWECHINGRSSDWLMIWEQNDVDLIMIMVNTGSHSDIF